MATPIVELVAEDIYNVVKAMTLANGKSYDYTPVRPAETWPNAQNAQVIILQEGRPIPVPLEQTPTGKRDWLWPFILTVQCVPGAANPDPVDTQRNVMFAEIHNALLADYQRSGNAIDTLIDEPEYYASPQGFWAVEMLVNIRLRTAYTDATSL